MGGSISIGYTSATELTFEWDEYNETKLLARHDVSASEVEQCFANGVSARRAAGAYLALGQTDGGRMLFMVFERRQGGVIRVYSAREMTGAERSAFRRDRS